jgi:micrococcal nuclease
MRIAAVAGPVAILRAAVAAMILLLGLHDSPAAAAGCGSRGGPGYRGPDGRCVTWADIGRTCGEPPTLRCTAESEHPNAAADPIDRAQIEIVDGDTVRIAGELVRLVGFDTPETGDDTARCDAERERGKKAAARLAELLGTGPLEIRYRKHRDQYGRRLARLTVNGENIGQTLIREQLAVRYRGSGPKMDWCPRSRR